MYVCWCNDDGWWCLCAPLLTNTSFDVVHSKNSIDFFLCALRTHLSQPRTSGVRSLFFLLLWSLWGVPVLAPLNSRRKAEIGRACLPAICFWSFLISLFYHRPSTVSSPMNIRNRCDGDNDSDFEIRHSNSAVAPPLMPFISHLFQLPCLLLIIIITTMVMHSIANRKRTKKSIFGLIFPIHTKKSRGAEVKTKQKRYFCLLFLSRNKFVILCVALLRSDSPFSCEQMNQNTEKKNGFSLSRRSRDSFRPFCFEKCFILLKCQRCRRWHCSGGDVRTRAMVKPF